MKGRSTEPHPRLPPYGLTRAAVWGLVGVLIISSGSGCATFGARDGLPAYDARPHGRPPPGVYVEGQDPCVPVLAETGLFRAVGATVQAPDAFLELKRRRFLGSNLGGAVLAGLTLFIAPTPLGTNTTVLKATVVSSRSGGRQEFEVERSTSTWVGLFILPFTFFRFPPAETQRAEQTLCGDLAIRLRQSIDGIEPP